MMHQLRAPPSLRTDWFRPRRGQGCTPGCGPLQPLICNLLQAFPEESRPKVPAHIYDVITKGQKDPSETAYAGYGLPGAGAGTVSGPSAVRAAVAGARAGERVSAFSQLSAREGARAVGT